MRRPEATNHHLVRHGDRLPFGACASGCACKLSTVRHRRCAGQGKAGRATAGGAVLAVGGDSYGCGCGCGCPGRQRHSSSCNYGRVRARLVELLRFVYSLRIWDLQTAGLVRRVRVLSRWWSWCLVRVYWSSSAQVLRSSGGPFLASWRWELVVAGRATRLSTLAMTVVWSGLCIMYAGAIYCHV